MGTETGVFVLTQFIILCLGCKLVNPRTWSEHVNTMLRNHQIVNTLYRVALERNILNCRYLLYKVKL